MFYSDSLFTCSQNSSKNEYIHLLLLDIVLVANAPWCPITTTFMGDVVRSKSSSKRERWRSSLTRISISWHPAGWHWKSGFEQGEVIPVSLGEKYCSNQQSTSKIQCENNKRRRKIEISIHKNFTVRKLAELFKTGQCLQQKNGKVWDVKSW